MNIMFDDDELLPGRTYTARVKSVSNDLESPFYLLNFTMSKFKSDLF